MKQITKEDSLFHGSYCIDPYQNCEFGCQYCDSSFRELRTIERGRIIIGSVNDPYQHLEDKFQLTRTVLEILQDHHLPCHILTKSPLILRDLPLLTNLESIVTISLSSLNEQVIRIFEPDVPTPTARLQTLQTLRKNGIKAGLALIPMLPYIVEPELESIFQAASEANAQYLLHKHLELKGDQEQHFRNLIMTHYPHLLPNYDTLYENTFKPQDEYLEEIHVLLQKYSKKFDIPDTITL